MYMINIGAAIGLAPYIAFKHGMTPVRREWQSSPWSIVTASLLVFIAYGLVLTAFSLSRVSYVGPAREVGIVFGVLLGVLVLKEQFGQGRLLGSTLIVLGLTLIALSPYQRPPLTTSAPHRLARAGGHPREGWRVSRETPRTHTNRQQGQLRRTLPRVT